MSDLEIAIVGMSARFPGAEDLEIFWRNLRDGKESISFFSDEELLSTGIDPALLKNPNYIKAKGILPNIDMFDASFFGYSPAEAELLDPQQRLFLEEAWKALEHAGYDPARYDGAIGVYAGASINTYLLHNLYPNLDLSDPVMGYQSMMGNNSDYLSTRVSYKFNLKGPSVNVQTACSTSLVAVHLACQSLLHGECDLALAGGVSITIPSKAGYMYQEGLILAPDGHCRPFDANAQGTVAANGVGVVVLKRLADALVDGDCIQALITGTAINNDGSLKVGYTAPSVDGQREAILEAQAIAGVDPETITYIETHGTGTVIGDPIEFRALTQAFRQSTSKKGFCAIGSVKSNIGHLDISSGIAGLIKTVLALQHQMLPPSLHFKQPNPQIDFEQSPFYVNTSLSEWKTDETPRRAGVSSFGIGGTNAHIILEEAPAPESCSSSGNSQLLLLSAKTLSALNTATANLSQYLHQHRDLNLADVAYTLHFGRQAFNYRRLLVCHSLDQASNLLETPDSRQVFTNVQEPGERSVAFMFPGQGAQYVNMGKELYQSEPTFREQVDRCAEILTSFMGRDVRQVLYPDTNDYHASDIHQTALTQPLLFVIEYALATLWMEWGITPQTMIGHSVGEYAAACLAGVLSLEDALYLLALRGRLMQQLPSGAMLSVQLSEQEFAPFLNQELSLAAVNTPSLCVVSGSIRAIDAIHAQLAAKGVACVRLHTSHGFHSRMMEPIVEEFIEQVGNITLHPPQIPWISTVTGTWVTAEEVMHPAYWGSNLRQTVRFADTIQHLLQDPNYILLEVGPGRTLCTLSKHHPASSSKTLMYSSLPHAQDHQPDSEFLLTTAGKLWLAGVPIQWSGFYTHERRQRVSLPTYPFERQRYWIESPKGEQSKRSSLLSGVKKSDMRDWFYIPSWERSICRPQPASIAEDLTWLVFLDECGMGEQLIRHLRQYARNIVTVKVGTGFVKLNDLQYTLNPQQNEDYDALIHDLRVLGKPPQMVLHLWSVTKNGDSAAEEPDNFRDTGFYSLLFLTQALEKQHVTNDLHMLVISNNIQDVTGEETLVPEKATILGPVKVISQEYPHIRCRSVDIVLPKIGPLFSGVEKDVFQALIHRLLGECSPRSSDQIIAYRGNYRWRQTFTPLRVEDFVEKTLALKDDGLYLITGGFGKIGLALATHLAKTVRGAKLILTGRSGFPVREQWQQCLDNPETYDSIRQKIVTLRQLEEFGANVLILHADVADVQDMHEVITQAERQFGQLNGVIHAAGITEGRSFCGAGKIAKVECERQFRPKVSGLRVLDEVLQKKNLDFCVLFSSLSSVLGGLEFIAYSAANLFMDAYVHWHNKHNPIPWKSINWDSWQSGHSMSQKVPFGSSSAEFAMTPEEGSIAFQRIVSWHHIDQIVVSTGDLHARIDQWLQGEFLHEQERVKETVPSSDHIAADINTVAHNSVEQMLRGIWSDVLGVAQVGGDDDFFELGGDSLLAVRLMSQIYKTFGLSLPMSTIFEGTTITSLARILSQPKEVAHTDSSLVVIQASGSRPPLFCVHPAGGNVFCYQELAGLLGSDYPFYGIQAPGLHAESSPHTHIEEMASHYIELVQAVQPKGPYLLGGFSMGGVVAFEMAQQFHQRGDQVVLLALFDSWITVPDNISNALHSLPEQASYAELLLAFFRENFGGSFAAEELPLSSETLSQLSPEQQIIRVLEQVKTPGLLAVDVDPLQFRRLFDVYKANVTAVSNYVPLIYPGRIAFFQAQEFRSDHLDGPVSGWHTLSTRPLSVYPVPGNHYTMLSNPHVQVLARQLHNCLDEAAHNDNIEGGT